MSGPLPHLTLTTSTVSLSPISSTSLIFPTVSPLHTSPMILVPFFTLRCSTAEWRINTNPISHTHAPKFEDGSEEESLKQERFVRRVAWTMARNLPKPKEKDKTTFLSLSEVWSLPAPSSTKPEERKIVVDSRGSLHKLSRKDLYSAELYSSCIQNSCKNYHCQRRSANERGINSVRLRSWFIRDPSRTRLQSYRGQYSAKIKDIPMTGQVVKKHFVTTQKIQCNTEHFVSILVPWLSTGSLQVQLLHQ